MPTDLPADVAAEIEAFDAAAGDILKPFLVGLEALPLPATIYHYTDARGLEGILSNGKLWLTDAFHLNDPTELRHGFSILNGLFAQRMAPARPEVRQFAEDLARFDQQGGVAGAARYFVGSFSQAGDDLNQWTRYADNGQGYALAFDTAPLEIGFSRLDGKPIPNNMTFPVAYDDPLIAELHSNLIELVLPLISLPRSRQMTRAQVNQYMMMLSVTFTVHALQAGLFFKHQGYRTEEEYRFMQIFPINQTAPDVLHRPRRTDSVAYREFDWRSSAPTSLKAVIVGPASVGSPEASAEARRRLDSNGLTGVEVCNSLLPYRAG